MLRVEYLNLTTDVSGDVIGTTIMINGLILAFEWLGNLPTVGLDALADLAVSVVDTGSGVDKPLLTLTDTADVNKTYYVRALEHDDVGAELATYDIPATVGKVQAVIADGGDTKQARLSIFFYSP